MRVQEELDLFDLAAAYMAQFRARFPEIMRGQMIQLHPLGTSLNDVPYDFSETPLPHGVP